MWSSFKFYFPLTSTKMALVLLLVTAMVFPIAGGAEDKTWIFSFSGNRRPYNYIDDKGKLVGFDLDLVRNVCRVADRKCSPTVQAFTECVQTVKGRFFPGRGIMAEWFDACVGFTITQERINALQFTLPYLQTYAKLAVKPGNPRRVTLQSLANHTITHLTGAYTNQQCLSRLKLTVGGVVVAANLPEAKALVLNGTVDAAFSPRSKIPDLETLDVTLHCDLGGVAVMVTKESKLPGWWNPAFQKFVRGGEYKKMCDSWMQKTKYRIKCIDDSRSAGVHSSGQANILAHSLLCIALLTAVRS